MELKNQNPALPNRNCLYLGVSGSGKSQCLKQYSGIPASARVIMFDPNLDHKATVRVHKTAEFYRALVACEKTGKPYRLAWSTHGNRQRDHEIFCEAVLHVLDGKRLTYVIDEELAQSCKYASKAEPFHEHLMNEGRKYGLVYHGAVQIPQRIPKTVFDNCPTMFIGQSKRLPDYVIENVGIEKDDAINLQPLEFFKCEGMKTTKFKMKYKK